MEIFKVYYFDSAHYLPNVPPDHKCRNMHGHTYKLIVFISGSSNNDMGWVMDFSDLKKTIQPIIESVDHKILNEIPGLKNPTCENIAKWLWEKIIIKIPEVTKIELHETPTTGVIYSGD